MSPTPQSLKREGTQGRGSIKDDEIKTEHCAYTTRRSLRMEIGDKPRQESQIVDTQREGRGSRTAPVNTLPQRSGIALVSLPSLSSPSSTILLTFAYATGSPHALPNRSERGADILTNVSVCVTVTATTEVWDCRGRPLANKLGFRRAARNLFLLASPSLATPNRELFHAASPPHIASDHGVLPPSTFPTTPVFPLPTPMRESFQKGPGHFDEPHRTIP
ncbi:hypothetical protein AB1N83_012533 [Pleurotus pulmonarius]